MTVGHILFDRKGAILQADDSFGSLLMTEPDRLRGLDVLSITAPADRDECSRAIERLLMTGRSFDITKRFVRHDDTVFWVRNSVSLMQVNDVAVGVATCASVPSQPPRRAPAVLLDSAREQLAMLHARQQVYDPRLFPDPGWQTLLEIYVAEAEGRVLDLAGLVTILGQSAPLVERWVAALDSFRLLEVETHQTRGDVPKTYRLTAEAIERLEVYLASFAPADAPLL